MDTYEEFKAKHPKLLANVEFEVLVSEAVAILKDNPVAGRKVIAKELRISVKEAKKVYRAAARQLEEF